MTFRGGTRMTGLPLVVVTIPPTTLFTAAADEGKPISDLDSTVKRGPLDVITGNETNSTKCVTLSFSLFLFVH